MAAPIYFLHDNTDLIFEEKGNSFSSIRKVQWAKEGAESDPEKAKYEIRKWYVSGEGENPGKGFTFLTPEGPGELAKTLIENNFGDTKELLVSLKERDDFKEAVEHMYDEDENNDSDDGEYFDARTALLS